MSDWNQFLISKGAIQGVDGLVDFPHVQLEPENTYLMSLERGLIEVKGPDSVKFLQGQVTCDVRELAEKTTRLGAQCNIKGRMLLCFRALQSDNERILLRVHAGLIANGLASLGKYIVFSKAKLADVTPNYRGLGVSGAQAAQIIKDIFAVELAKDDDWQPAGEHLIIRIAENRYECWIAADEAEVVWDKLNARAASASQNLWNLLNIQAGIGDITPETLEAFTPQAINFQLVNGINFRKGCYTGQEIVARLHYRGTLKRHMYRFAFSDSDNGQPLPISGTELKNADGKVVGEVILAAWVNKTRGELLASVVDDERIAIYLANNPEKLSLLALPYAIPTPNEAD